MLLIRGELMSNQYKKLEVNVETGEETYIDLTSEELEATLAEEARVAALPKPLTEKELQAVEDEKRLAKEAAQAKLAALGLTADDLKALGL